MHSLGFVHRDIKLEYILLSAKQEEIYLADFGLSKSINDKESGCHVKKVVINRFQGNLLFAPLNALHARTTSRLDDIESTFYLLIYWLNKSRLPWTQKCFE